MQYVQLHIDSVQDAGFIEYTSLTPRNLTEASTEPNGGKVNGFLAPKKGDWPCMTMHEVKGSLYYAISVEEPATMKIAYKINLDIY